VLEGGGHADQQQEEGLWERHSGDVLWVKMPKNDLVVSRSRVRELEDEEMWTMDGSVCWTTQSERPVKAQFG